MIMMTVMAMMEERKERAMTRSTPIPPPERELVVQKITVCVMRIDSSLVPCGGHAGCQQKSRRESAPSG